MKYKVTHTNVNKTEVKQSIEALLHFIVDNKVYDIQFSVVSKDHKKEDDAS